ncbi:MAG: type 4a pilus biogenesis protein PilO [bacterium]
MRKDSLIIISSIMAAAAIIFFLIMPAFDELSLNKDNITGQQERIARIEAFGEKIKTLNREYDKNPEAGDKLLTVLPKEKELAKLLIGLESLATGNGLTMESVDFMQIQTQQNISMPAQTGEPIMPQAPDAVPVVASDATQMMPAQTVPSAEIYKTLLVKLRLSGNYDAFKTYLKAVEGNERVMDVMVFTFANAQSGAEQNALSFSVDLYVYYQ